MATKASFKTNRRELQKELQPQLELVKSKILLEDYQAISEKVGCTEDQVICIMRNSGGVYLMPRVLNAALEIIEERQQMLQQNQELFRKIKEQTNA
jgi:hypothetical protein